MPRTHAVIAALLLLHTPVKSLRYSVEYSESNNGRALSYATEDQVESALTDADADAGTDADDDDANANACGGFWPGTLSQWHEGTQVPSDDQPLPSALNISGSRDRCSQCLLQPKCQWCPLSQSCMPTKKGCKVRKNFKQYDVPVTSQCEALQVLPWKVAVNELLQKEWDTDSGRPRHLDAIRCVEWSLKWPITPDEKMKTADYDSVGSWACRSTLLRQAILDMMDEKNIAPGFSNSYPEDDKLERTPELCSIIAYQGCVFKAVQKGCETKAYGVNQFHELRQLDGLPNHKKVGGSHSIDKRLAKAIESGPLVTFSPGAGKSGSGFASTWDNEFKVKLGLKDQASMHEPENLFKLLRGVGKTESLVEYLKKHPSSMLNRHYGLLTLKINGVKTWVSVLGDAYYTLDAIAAKEATYVPQYTTFNRYDLKGKSRDETKRLGSGFALINGDFEEREDSLMLLSNKDCEKFNAAVRLDSKFLEDHHMLDYSVLLLSVERPVGSKTLTCKDSPGKPFCFEHGDHLYTISIIDYLNDHNAFKTIESIFHHGKFDHYSMKINNFAERMCPTADTKQMTSKLRVLLKRSNNSITEAFKAIDTDHSGAISAGEFKAFFKDELKESNLKKLFAEVDIDGHGTIGLEDFSNIFKAFRVGSMKSSPSPKDKSTPSAQTVKKKSHRRSHRRIAKKKSYGHGQHRKPK